MFGYLEFMFSWHFVISSSSSTFILFQLQRDHCISRNLLSCWFIRQQNIRKRPYSIHRLYFVPPPSTSCSREIHSLCCAMCDLLSHSTLLSVSLFFPCPQPLLMASIWCLPSHGHPPPRPTHTHTLQLQPLLQGWEQPHRTVSHQFCARRLRRTISAALARCAAGRSPSLCLHWGGTTGSTATGCHLVSPPLSPLPLLCCSSFPFLHPLLFFCPSLSFFVLLIIGVATMKYCGTTINNNNYILASIKYNQTALLFFFCGGRVVRNLQ